MTHLKTTYILACLFGLFPSLVIAQELTPPVRLDPPGLDRNSSEISPDARFVSLSVWDGSAQRLLLFSADSRTGTEIVGPGSPGGGGNNQFFNPEGTRVAYQTLNQGQYLDLPVDLATPAVVLAGGVGAGEFVSRVAYSPDGIHVVYEGRDNGGSDELYSVPRDRSSPSVQLTNNTPLGASLQQWSFSPDGLTLVYRANQGFGTPFLLYRVSVDGSSAPVELIPLPTSTTLTGQSWWFSPDSSQILYVANATDPGVRSLYSLRLDSSTPAVLLSNTFAGNGGIVEFAAISPDGRTVVYRQLFPSYMCGLGSVSIDGGPITTLSKNMREISDASFTPDGQRILWTETSGGIFNVYGTSELKSVPVGMGLPAAAELDSQAWTNSPISFRLSFMPDSTRVAYWSPFSTVELWSVLVNGGGRVLLNAGRPKVLWSATQSPDGKKMFYTEYDANNVQRNLFSVPIDGSASPQQINLTLNNGSRYGVVDFAVSENGRGITYSVDLGFWNEIYATWLAVGLDSISPVRGSAMGGTMVTLSGSGFSPDSEVFFGGVAATSTQFVDETTLRAVAPATTLPPPRGRTLLAFQRVPVSVTVSDAGTEDTLKQAFTYRR